MTLNLAVEIAANPSLIADYKKKILQPQYIIPSSFTAEFKAFLKVKEGNKATLINKVTSPVDFQKLIDVLSIMQSNREQVMEKVLYLYELHYLWSKLKRGAERLIQTTFFDELSSLNAGAKKEVISNAIHDIVEGVKCLDFLCEQGDLVLAHLDKTIWNIKESSTLAQQVLYHLSKAGQLSQGI